MYDSARQGVAPLGRIGAVAVFAVVASTAAITACGDGDKADGSQQAVDSAPGTTAEQAAPVRTIDATSEAEASAAAASYGAYIDYLNWESGGGACSRMTAAFKRGIGAGGSRDACRARIEEIFRSSDTVKGKRTVVRTKIDGNRATLTVRARSGETRKIVMAKQGGRWRIDGGTPWK